MDETTEVATEQGLHRLAWAMSPRLTAHLLAMELEEKQRRRFWEDG